MLPAPKNTQESSNKQFAIDEGHTAIEHYSSKEDQQCTTPPSQKPPTTSLDKNAVTQIIPTAKRALQFEKKVHIDQQRPATANTIQVATDQLSHSKQADFSMVKQPSTKFSPGPNCKRHKKITETSTNAVENQLQQPKIGDQQSSSHKEQEP